MALGGETIDGNDAALVDIQSGSLSLYGVHLILINPKKE